MKKILITLLAAFFILSSCNINIEDDKFLRSPDIEEISSGIAIRIPQISDTTEYVSIYRRDITDDKDDPESCTPVNIGIIFHSEYKNEQSYFFEDNNIHINHCYQYRVKYVDKETAFYSKWTSSITASKGYAGTTKFSYNTTGANVIYDDRTQTFKISGNITLPQMIDADNYEPVLSFKSEKSTQVFLIESIANNTVIPLRTLLPPEFQDVEIELLGICAQKKDYSPIESTDEDRTPKVRKIIWSELAPLKILGNQENKITVKSETGTNGYDYS